MNLYGECFSCGADLVCPSCEAAKGYYQPTTEKVVREMLAGYIHKDNSLDENFDGLFWHPSYPKELCINSVNMTPNLLRAIAWWIEHKSKVTEPIDNPPHTIYNTTPQSHEPH